MDLDEYLNRFIEGYLFQDLKSMASIKLPEGSEYGAVGYPMVMTALSGIEMLGSLTSRAPLDDGKGSFGHFWKVYMYPGHQGRARLHEFVYQFVRNGIAHSFITKPMVVVTKHRDENHLTQDGDGVVRVDALHLADELEHAYRERLRPTITGAFKVEMEKRFRMIREASWAEFLAKKSLREKFPIGAAVAVEVSNQSTRVNSPSVNAFYSTRSPWVDNNA